MLPRKRKVPIPAHPIQIHKLILRSTSLWSENHLTQATFSLAVLP